MHRSRSDHAAGCGGAAVAGLRWTAQTHACDPDPDPQPPPSLRSRAIKSNPRRARPGDGTERPRFGIELPRCSEQRGIVHVIGPELGARKLADYRLAATATATHGAFGASPRLGTTEVAMCSRKCLLRSAQNACNRSHWTTARGVTGQGPLAIWQDRRISANDNSSISRASGSKRLMDERMPWQHALEAGHARIIARRDDVRVSQGRASH